LTIPPLPHLISLLLKGRKRRWGRGLWLMFFESCRIYVNEKVC
jgi:hypothetical protein